MEGSSSAEERLRPLFLRGLEGDEAAYTEFLKACAAHLRGFLRRRLSAWPDREEDLVQEVLIGLHNQRASYAPEIPLTAWIHAIARYKLVDFLRRTGRQEALSEPLSDALDDELSMQVDGGLQSMQAQRDLAKLMAGLPAPQREAILHMKVDGWTVKETASAMQVTESWVKVAVHRGLKTLAAQLGKDK